MRVSLLVWSFCLPALVVPVVAAQSEDIGTADRPYVIQPCHIMPIHEAQLSAEDPGILVALEVREGAKVEPDQLLAKLDDDKPQLQLKMAESELKVANKQAENDIDKQIAEKAEALTKIDYVEALDARRRVPDALSDFELRRREFTWKRQESEVEKADRDLELAQINVELAAQKVDAVKNEIERRKVTAPFHGVVAETIPHVGEWVSQGQPILRLVNMDRLRVQGYVDSNDFAAYELYGKTVTIEVILARDDTTREERVERFTSKISFVAPTVDAAGQFRVFAEFDNRQSPGGFYIVRPGLGARMILNSDTAWTANPVTRR
jgi:multidrug efflux pump subunit AcrA (membrane-fusion protein)